MQALYQPQQWVLRSEFLSWVQKRVNCLIPSTKKRKTTDTQKKIVIDMHLILTKIDMLTAGKSHQNWAIIAVVLWSVAHAKKINTNTTERIEANGIMKKRIEIDIDAIIPTTDRQATEDAMTNRRIAIASDLMIASQILDIKKSLIEKKKNLQDQSWKKKRNVKLEKVWINRIKYSLYLYKFCLILKVFDRFIIYELYWPVYLVRIGLKHFKSIQQPCLNLLIPWEISLE